MNILVAGQHLELGASLQEYVKDKINEVVLRYFENATSASVHFSKDGRRILCDMVVREGSGGHVAINSEATADDVYVSFDLALAKSERRLRKYKSKLKDRHNKIKISDLEALQATKYTICSIAHDIEVEPAGAVIIAEQVIDVPKVTVSEAVMKMELENLQALMFQNSKTDRMNVVYLRRDGNIAWVDSR